MLSPRLGSLILASLLAIASLAPAARVRADDDGEPARAGELGRRGVATGGGRVGVVLLPRGAADAEMTDSLTELLIATLASRGAREIVGKEEFQAALGRDDAGTLACIESNPCLARMGRELRVGELVAGTLRLDRDASAGEHYRFDLYRLDAATGHVRGRVAREIDGGLEALLGALTSSIDELYLEHVEPGALVLAVSPRDARVELDGQPLEAGLDGFRRRGFLSPGRHRLVARASGHEPLSRELELEAGTTLMLSLALVEQTSAPPVSLRTGLFVGLSGALLASGIGLGLSSQLEPEGALTMRASQRFYADRVNDALAANVLFALAGAAAIGALVSLGVDLSSEPDVPPEALEAALRGELARW